MEITRATTEAGAYQALEASKGDEESFYALCSYINALQDNYKTVRTLKKVFKNKRNDLFLRAGETLFDLLEQDTKDPSDIWSDVNRAMFGGDRSLMLFTKPGAAHSVGRKIKNNLPSLKKEASAKSDDKYEITIDTNGIVLAENTSNRYGIRGRRKKLVWLLAQSKKPIRMKECATTLGVGLYEDFKIGGDKRAINKHFKEKLGVVHDLIVVVSDGYTLNRDAFNVSVSLT